MDEVAAAEGLGRTGLEHEFSLWARAEGFLATEAVLTAGNAAIAAGYEIEETARGRIALALPGDDEPFVDLDASFLADLPLDDDEGRMRFQLHLDVLSGRISREEAIAIALKLDPPGTLYMGDEFGERAPLEHPSETAELIAEAYDALDEGVDPAQVAAFLGLGLFPPSTISSAVDLAIAFSPIGLIQDAADFEAARRDLAEAEAVGDAAAIDDAQNRMIVAIIGLTPAGKAGDAAKALFKGAKAAAKDGIRALRSSDTLVEKSFEQSANAFKRRYGFKLDQLIGPKWRDLSPRIQSEVRGTAANAYGKLAEKVARAPATERLSREGYEVFDREIELIYQGTKFRIDVVGIKKGAVPAAAASKKTILIEGQFYKLTDVSLVDIKFASAGWSRNQRLVAKPLSKHLRVESPRIDELPAQEVVDIINGIEQLKSRGISITRAQYDKFIQNLPSGTRLHDFILPLMTALLFQREFTNASETKGTQPSASSEYL